jgi:hypothetical protein
MTPDLQPTGPSGIPTITVRPRANTSAPQAQPEGSLDSLPEWQPQQQAQPQAAPGPPAPGVAAAPAQSLDALPEWQPAAESAEPGREIGTGDAALSGARDALTFGFQPALAGVTEASKAATGPVETVAGGVGSALDLANPLSLVSQKLGLPSNHDIVRGVTGLIHHYGSSEQDQAVQEAYRRGREAALQDQQLAREQHPAAYTAGLVGGSLLTPIPGVGGGGSLLANAARTGAAGVATGALQGVGAGVSEGQALPEVAARGARGGAVGGVVGGAVGAVLPRAIGAITRGQRAARTAEELGAPIPRGLASDRAAINAATASARSVPLVGSRISSAVNRTQEAAGNRVEDIASGMTGGALDRAAADTLVRPGLQQAIERNRQAIDALYNNARSRIDTAARFTMPRTRATLDAVEAARRQAGHVNPAEGLQQFRNVANGATFNGAHRARVDAREAGNGLVPHPGYNAADYNRLTRAMTADLRAIVHAAAHGTAAEKAAAVHAFDEAERAFGPLAEMNSRLNRLANSRGEGAMSSLLGAAREKGGDTRLLAELRATMPRAEFEQIGGVLLHELGQNAATGEFSLAKFVTEFSKTSPRARAILFSPQHLQEIENIFEMGQHIKGALRESNSSHTSNALILFDLARDAVLVGGGVAMGVVSGASVATGGAAAAPAVLFARWLASPATATSMSRWSTAYRAMTLGQPTPARIAAFNIASRNLANNLGLPVDKVLQAAQNRLTARADDDTEK